MKFNRAKMDKMRNDIARNAKMKIQNSTDAECCESPVMEGMEKSIKKEPEYREAPVSRKHYKSGGGWAGK
jgi:hypothetical protein